MNYTTKTLLVLVFLFTSLAMNAQKTTIKGNVSDETGEPVIGATIVTPDAKNGAFSDLEGNFTLSTTLPVDIKVSFLGYQSQTVKVKKADDFVKVILRESSKSLDDVVVVGYGVQKKSDLSSAISTIKSDELMQTSITSFDQGIQGRAAGVAVLNTTGQPGAGTSIRIRGTSSINGNNEPLYVIDGVPVISDANAFSTGTLKNPSLNPIISINPADIASIEILKDASATSIYGARGANGVVLVTIKQGKAGKAKISVGMRYSLQKLSKKMDLLSSVELAQLGNEATDNAGQERRVIFAGLNNISKINTDWQDEIFRVAPMQNYDVSVSGGNEKTSYFVSGNLLLQDGIIICSDFGKGNVRMNLTQQLNKWLTMGASLNLSYSRSHGVVTNSEGGFASSITSWALDMNPALPVRQENGEYTYENNLTTTNNVGNPVQDAHEAKNRNTSFRTLGNAYLQWAPIKNLILKSSIGIDYFYIKDQAFAPGYIKRAESNEGYASVANLDAYNWVWENTVTYNIQAGKHHVTALGGITAQKYNSENSNVATAKFDDGYLKYYSIQSGSQRQAASSGITEWQMLSYLARINYNYDNRYLLTLTGRIDGSSKFGKHNKYGFFPAVSGAWRISEESFMKNIKTVSNLKLRLSYGVVGNEGIPAYSSQGLMYNTEAYVGNSTKISGLVPFTLSNQDLKWEKTRQMNFGIDLGLFDSRLSLTADYYYKKTSDLLLAMPVSFNTGYDQVVKNVGDLKNTGFDFSIGVVPLTGKLNWNVDITFGYNRNEVTNLAGSTENLMGNSILGITYWTKITEGKAMGTLYGYKTNGVAQKDEDLSRIPFFQGKTITYGDRKYVDKDDNGVINENDLFELGNANPDFTFGFNNTFRLRLPDQSLLGLTIYLQGSVGNEIANFNKFTLESFDGYHNNTKAALKRWTDENPSNTYPKATIKSQGNVFSDHYVEDGSYLRFKDITLNYSLPNKWTRKFLCENLTISVSLKNLWTITNYSGYDPEVSRFANNNLSMGADYGSYPMAKSYEFGIRMNF